MAPIDRREHRQQRVRGAGPSSVQASFGFNFGALGARPAKQSSLPPQRSSRRTPIRSTTRGTNGSAQRQRSASVQRSGSAKPRSSPKDPAVTPHLGKRKRGAASAPPGAEDEEKDELSPDHNVPSIEKSRRVIGTVSPIREENDDVPDELSILGDEASTLRKQTPVAAAVVNGTPVSVLAHKRTSSGAGRARTPIADRVGNMTVSTRQSISRRSKSIERGPITPSLPPNGRPSSSSASRFGPTFDTPGAGPVEEESEDELSPPQINGTTPRVVSSAKRVDDSTQDNGEMDVDELSSPLQPSTLQDPPSAQAVAQNQTKSSEKEATQPQPAKRGRPRRVIEDEDEEPATATPITAPKRGRPAKNASIERNAAPMPATSKAAKTKSQRIAGDQGDEEVDELPPNKDVPALSTKKASRKEKEIVISDEEASDEYESEEIEEESVPTPRIPAKRKSPKQTQVKPSTEGPPRKRHKFLGPKHAISVMRIKGSAVRGITVADTTRTILEETIDYRLNRMAEKLQNSQDSAQRKDLRSEINLSLSFKESLNEKLLDLQDANDVLSTNLKKMKLFKRDNAELRKEILTLQNNRQEIALEHDDVQMEYEAEKAKIDTKNQLSENMFDIEAAIRAGKERAQRLGREDEGPEIPLTMLLDMVGRDVSSSSGGLLSNVKSFNGMLERAAGWLEGRV